MRQRPRFFRRVAAVLFLCSILAPVAYSQRAITGFVRAPSGEAPHTSIEIILYSQDGQLLQRDYANADGFFVLSHVSCAICRLVVQAEGYQTWESRIELRYGLPREYRVTIYLQPLEKPGASPKTTRTVKEYQVPRKAQREFEDAQKAFQEGKYTDAMEGLRRALAIYPSYLEALNLLGAVHMKEKRYAEAEITLLRAVAIEAKYVDAYVSLGSLYILTGHPKEAVQKLEKALTLSAGSWKAHYELCMAYYELQDYKKALPHCDQAENQRGKDLPEAVFQRASIYWHLQRFADAEKEFREFVKQYPKSPYAAAARKALEEIEKTKQPSLQQP